MSRRTYRTITTGSGHKAVQIVERDDGKTIVHQHLGTAHDDEELARLHTQALRILLAEREDEFLPCFTDPEPDGEPLHATHVRSYSSVLWDALAGVYDRLGFDTATENDRVFKQLVVARVIEPTSKLDTIRVLADLGLPAPSNTGIHRCLKRAIERDYRGTLATQCTASRSDEALTLVLYDVTTLFFHIDREDDFRIPGFSKERRLEPQIVIGLLVDKHGFPLQVDSFEGNTAETHTIRPVLEKFREQHPGTNITVVADAAMLSGPNTGALEDAGFGFIVGSRITKTPYEIAEYSNTGNDFVDGQIFDVKVMLPGPARQRVERRVVYQYRAKRARMDVKNIDTQVAKATAIVEKKKPLKKSRFVVIGEDTEVTVDEEGIAAARARAGIKGYVTNLYDVDPQFIIDAYHQLFNVEASFRMSKSDLRARPIHHQLREKIDAHLTIVFAALAISRRVQETTGMSIRKFLTTIEPLRTAIVRVDGKEHIALPEIPAEQQAMLDKIRNPNNPETPKY